MTYQKDTLFKATRMRDLNSSDVGTIGEYFVASILGGFGLEVTKADASGYDLLVIDEGRPVRIDVKTTTTDKKRRMWGIAKGKTGFFRDYDAKNCDVFALLCLEDQALTFERCKDYEGKRSIYLSAETHKSIDPYKSWLAVVLED